MFLSISALLTVIIRTLLPVSYNQCMKQLPEVHELLDINKESSYGEKMAQVERKGTYCPP